MTLDIVIVPFYTAIQIDELSHEALQDWLHSLNRAQREYAARVSGRARTVLNASHRLNRWLTAEVRQDLFDRHYELQVFKKI